MFQQMAGSVVSRKGERSPGRRAITDSAQNSNADPPSPNAFSAAVDSATLEASSTKRLDQARHDLSNRVKGACGLVLNAVTAFDVEKNEDRLVRRSSLLAAIKQTFEGLERVEDIKKF